MEFKGKYKFLSNFFLCKVEYEDKIYKSAEHAYQASKTDDEYWSTIIAEADTPNKAKQCGKKCPYIREDWDEVKINIMKKIVYNKFMHNDKLKQQLIATSPSKLIEGNYWHDNWWGSCFCQKCKNIQGSNMLGLILMDIREQSITKG
jgi:ribA/ribD-fused uncharacterized protein